MNDPIPDTQRAAWNDMQPKLGPRQQEVFDELVLQPSTGFEIATRLGRELYTVLPRINELQEKNIVVDSGARRQNPTTKKNAIVWRLA